MKLKAVRVMEILKDCLFREGEDESIAVKAEGVMNNFGFHPDRLEIYKTEIGFMLAELPKEFQPHPDGGGGWSFLNACMTKDGEQWGEHRDIEGLVVLGIATGQAIFNMPKDMWSVLPGGMPYFGVVKP